MNNKNTQNIIINLKPKDMEKLELFFNVASVIIAPLFAISIVYSIITLCKNGLRELSFIDLVNVLSCIIMPMNMQMFYNKQPEYFMNALWPSGLCLISIIAVILFICLISRFYADIKVTMLLSSFTLLFPFFTILIAGHYYVSGVLNFWLMIALALAIIFITVCVCCFKSVWAEFKLRRLRKSLEPEYNSILNREERKLKRMKSKKLEELQNLYLSLCSEDYARYGRYSKNKNYPKPLVLGSTIVGFSLSVIGRELRFRKWNH